MSDAARSSALTARDSAVGAPHLKVDVILTCFNEGPYIGAAVRSVLEQTRADLVESIVIADDGSDQATIATLRDIERWDHRIRVLYGPGGAGLPAQRNRAIAIGSAPVLALLDGDDVWVATKLARELPRLEAQATVGLVYSGYFVFGVDDLRTAHEARVLDITAAQDLVHAYFLRDPPIIPSTILVRRSAFEACGGFDASVRVFEDSDFYFRLCRVTRFAFVREPLVYKRNRRESITGARKDLMAHHAFVAFRAAAQDPRLLPLVPRRLAERARKLGNTHFLLGDASGAARLFRLAARLDPWNLRVRFSLIVAVWLARPVYRLMERRLKPRRVALGGLER